MESHVHILAALFAVLALCGAYKVHPGVMSAMRTTGAGSDRVNSCSKTKVEVHHDRIEHAWDIEGIRGYAQMAGWKGLVRSGIFVDHEIQLGNYPGNWTFQLQCKPYFKGIKLSLNYTTEESTPFQIHANVALVSDNSSIVVMPFYLHRLNQTFSDKLSQSRIFFDHSMKKQDHDFDPSVTYYNSWIIFEEELEYLPLGEASNDRLTLTFSIDVTHAEIVGETDQASEECSQMNFAKAKENEIAPFSATLLNSNV